MLIVFSFFSPNSLMFFVEILLIFFFNFLLEEDFTVVLFEVVLKELLSRPNITLVKPINTAR